METVVDLLKEMGRVAQPIFVVLVFGTGVALLCVRRTSALGRRWLAAALIGYWALATAPVSQLLSAPLARGHRRVENAADAHGATAVVVLGGGVVTRAADGAAVDDLFSSALRLIEGVRVWRLLPDAVLIVSGGHTQQNMPARAEAEALRDAALRLGVPPQRIVMEDQSMTTREQAIRLKPLLAARGVTRFVLVTSSTHMSRSMAAFRSVGLDPTESAARLRNDGSSGAFSVYPDREALQLSDSAIYEYAATVYYWARGWLRPDRGR
jgi:uncharacterized SAM-binding protein YcdF (DUF218 family)